MESLFEMKKKQLFGREASRLETSNPSLALLQNLLSKSLIYFHLKQKNLYPENPNSSSAVSILLESAQDR